MFTYDLNGRQGFDVLHNSGEWRIAIHAFDREVNGLEAFKSWGIHSDSEEAFILLNGAAWLVLPEADAKSDTGFLVFPLEKQQIYLVRQGERHAIILDEKSDVLIIENRDMSLTCSEPVGEDVVEAVRRMIGGCKRNV